MLTATGRKPSPSFLLKVNHFKKTLHEFQILKTELFGEFKFVIPSPEDQSKWDRYNALWAELRPFLMNNGGN